MEITMSQKVNDPNDVRKILEKRENRNIFGADKGITTVGCYSIVLKRFLTRRFPGNKNVTLHYEIVWWKKTRDISVEIHSELPKLLPEVHNFLYEQFQEHGLSFKGNPRGSLPAPVNKPFRFAQKIIEWRTSTVGQVIAKIQKAVDELYGKYDSYLSYVEKFYTENETVDGCTKYADYIVSKV